MCYGLSNNISRITQETPRSRARGSTPENVIGSRARTANRSAIHAHKGKESKTLYTLVGVFICLKTIRKESAEHGKSRSGRRYTGSI